MRTINYLIVRSKSIYNNSKDGFITNTSVESVSNINRDVEVVAAPEYTPLEEGDRVTIHHNILRFRNNMRGKVVQSNYFLGYQGEYTLYFVPLTEVFMYKKPEGSWEALDPFCFVSPITSEKREDLVLDEEDSNEYKGNLKHYGTVEYSNPSLEGLGIFKGDKVAFSNFSEYEFEVDGDLMYKMSTKDILLKL